MHFMKSGVVHRAARKKLARPPESRMIVFLRSINVIMFLIICRWMPHSSNGSAFSRRPADRQRRPRVAFDARGLCTTRARRGVACRLPASARDRHTLPSQFDQVRGVTTLSYRVQLVPRPIVIDRDGLPVRNSHVIDIVFPGDTTETILGRVNTIVGPGVAKILVGDTTIRGVPLY
jgi:hypothetical protein